MIVVNAAQLEAHERDQRGLADALALQWYRQQGDVLPPLPDDRLRAVLAEARAMAEDIGLLEDEDDRLRRLLAFLALIPDPTDEQWLLGIDAVFDLPDARDAILRFTALAEDRR